LHRIEQPFLTQWFDEVVGGMQTRTQLRCFRGGVSSHDDHPGCETPVLNLLQDIYTEAIAENDIGKYQVEFPLIHFFQSFTITCRRGHLMSLGGEKPMKAESDRFFIIEDKYIRLHF
jgi:hypothetical protein